MGGFPPCDTCMIKVDVQIRQMITKIVYCAFCSFFIALSNSVLKSMIALGPILKVYHSKMSLF